MMNKVVIKKVNETLIEKILDIDVITLFNKSQELFERYFQEQNVGQRIFWIALIDDIMVGYVTLCWASKYPYFYKSDIPEIMDLNVLGSYRNSGIGSKLLDVAEQEARIKNNIVGLGVGLYKDYGSAQRLYIKRGYILDGNGVTYNYQPCIPGHAYRLDDDFILWFTKNLV